MKRLVLLSLSLTALVACKSEEITQFPRTDVGADVVADAVADTDADADAGADVAEAALAGRPCEVDADCGEPGWQCANRQLLDNFGVSQDINLPGGMCTRLLCSSDEDGGEGGAEARGVDPESGGKGYPVDNGPPTSCIVPIYR